MKRKYLGWKITGSYIELINVCVILRELGLVSLDNHIPCDRYCVTIYYTGYYGLTNASSENTSNTIEAKEFINEYNEYKKQIKNKQVMETRDVKVTLETAQRWYGQGGEFKEMALSAYTDAELNPVKNEWESKFVGNDIDGYYITSMSIIHDMKAKCSEPDKSTFKTEKQAKSALAYAQLTQLMALPEYNGDWVADWTDGSSKYCIIHVNKKLMVDLFYGYAQKICFKSGELAEIFLENNLDLIKQFNEMD